MFFSPILLLLRGIGLQGAGYLLLVVYGLQLVAAWFAPGWNWLFTLVAAYLSFGTLYATMLDIHRLKPVLSADERALEDEATHHWNILGALIIPL